ncbi:phiSA1p31-related protein [Streptomyces sp. NBC_01571]|uniref:phiSA1p31-related protein n=1 Tax=Streptomyces sp. NBC_01571 TaxID=2975883 RepID=UPI00225287E3|nr:phiSA1p31-related protein [Streptomyces sp. NBC_01571]MCX4572308.1 phiSA1p31-related protein [Streptomyces sp. NBC_01571]
MAETFKAGDKVTTTRPSMPQGTIVFGPYRSAVSNGEWALVQAPDGTAVSVPASSLTLAPAFTIGETVEERAMGRTVTIEAGPFKGLAGKDQYVVKFVNVGHHAWVSATGLRKRPAPTTQLASWERELLDGRSSRSVTYAGRPYSLDGEYTDRQGDVWKFNGRMSSDGTPLMECALYPVFDATSLAEVVRSYGPLSRV